MSIIEIKNLSHRFADGTLGIRNIHLSIKKGEFVILAGKNGSGKTTLLMHLNGLLLPESGEVQVAGKQVYEDLPRARQLVGMVFQNPDNQIIGETVYDDVAFGPENLCMTRPEVKRRVEEAVEKADLTSKQNQSPHLLSGGEKRRLALAGVLAMKPEVIVLDEPFASLDYPATCRVLKDIVALHREGHTILLATHDLEKALAHASRLVIMDGGTIAEDGDPDRLIRGTEKYGIRQPCAVRLGGEVSSWLS